MSVRRALLLGTLSALSVLSACGGYAHQTREAREALSRGRASEALTKLNALIEEGDADGGTAPLLYLERAVTRQRTGDHQGASRDFQRADEALEVLDYTSATPQEVARFLFSDSSAPYRPPAYEKALINLLNMVSYLARGDVSGARVEARRFEVYRGYFEGLVDQDEASRGELGGLLTLGATLSAFSALSVGAYDQAERLSAPYPALAARVAQARAERARPLAERPATLLVISAEGAAPYRRALRLPLARAVIIINASQNQSGLSQQERARLQVMSARAATKWLNFVELVTPPPPPPARLNLQDVSARAPQRAPQHSALSEALTLTVDLGALARRAFAQVQPKLLAAAVTRLLTRATTGAVTEGVSKERLGPLGGLLLGLAVEGVMSAADTPDTRGWVSLPARLQLWWLTLSPGDYRLKTTLPSDQGAQLTLKPGDVKLSALPLLEPPNSSSSSPSPSPSPSPSHEASK